MSTWLPCVPANCPPAEARPAEGVVFRVTDGETPAPRDFVPMRLERPEQSFVGRECLAAGLSVYKRRRDLERLKSYPTFRGRSLWVAKAELSPDHGVLLATPPKAIRNSHHT